MLIFCNYLEAHIMMWDIKLIRVFLSCYKRILLSHQIIVSSRPHFFSSTLFFPTNISSPQKRRKRIEVYKNRIKVGVEEKKKTQGMRRDSAHFCAPSPLFSLFFFTPFWVVCVFIILFLCRCQTLPKQTGESKISSSLPL